MKKSLKIFLIILSIVTTLSVFCFTNKQVVYAAQNVPTASLLISDSVSMKEDYYGIPKPVTTEIPVLHNEEEFKRIERAQIIVLIILFIFFLEAITFVIYASKKRKSQYQKNNTKT